jgi:hypothetical protein
LLLLALLQVLFGMALIASQLDRADADQVRDFVIQLTAGRVADLDGYDKLYSYEAQIQRQSEIVDRESDEVRLLPFNHPPLLAPALKPLSRTSNSRALLIWIAISLSVFAFAGHWLVKTLLVPPASLREGVTATLAILVFLPILIALIQGQDTPLLFAGVAGWTVLFRSRRDLAAGLLLSITAIRPHMALTLGLPFLFARKRVFLGWLLGILLLSTWSIALVGVNGIFDYFELLSLTGSGVGVSSGQVRMPNLLGFLSRRSPEGVTPPLIFTAWMAWTLGITFFSILWARTGDRLSCLHLGLLVLVGTFLLPHIHLHDLSVLAVPVVVAASALLAVNKDFWNRPLLALGGASFALGLAIVSSGPLFDLSLVFAISLIAVPLRFAFLLDGSGAKFGVASIRPSSGKDW